MFTDKFEKYAEFNAVELPDFLSTPKKIDVSDKMKKNPLVKDNILLRSQQNTQEEYDDMPMEAAEVFSADEPDENFVELKGPVVDSIKKLDTSDKNKEYLIKLAKIESGLRPNVVNRFGYTGLYQFNKSSLKDVNMNLDEYKSDINKQHEAALKYGEFNLKRLKNYTKYIGTIFNGIKITREGLMAASHLGGASNVMNYFNSGGKDDFKDANGTPISSYIKMFSK